MAQALVEIGGLDQRKHRAEDLLLGEDGVGRDVGEEGWLQEIAAFAGRGRVAAGDQAALFFADFNVVED